MATTTHKASVSTASSEFVDFFSPEVFQIVLHNPTTAHQLLRFSQTRFCGENMEFLDKVRHRSHYSEPITIHAYC